MQLTKKQRQETGAFYTPVIWANKAVEYIQEFIPNLDDFIFYDPAAGEGALLEVLPNSVEKYATTIENEDVDILRGKGITANQFDFLNGDITKLPIFGKENLIVFTNPPFVKLPANNNCLAKIQYKTNDATALFFYRILLELRPFLLCSFSKTDILQGSNSIKIRQDLQIYERCQSGFLSPSKSWNLKGDFPILFAIYANYSL